MNKVITKYFSEIGKRGGSAKTPKKIQACRENGKKGGRPPKVSVKTLRKQNKD